MEKWKERYASFDNERNWRIIEAVRAVAKEHGTTETAVSLGWLLQKPAVSSVIFGARSTEQLDDNLKADGLTLTDRLNALHCEHGYVAELQFSLTCGP